MNRFHWHFFVAKTLLLQKQFCKKCLQNLYMETYFTIPNCYNTYFSKDFWQHKNICINIYILYLKSQYLSKTKLVTELKFLKFSCVKEIQIKNCNKTQNIWLQLFYLALLAGSCQSVCVSLVFCVCLYVRLQNIQFWKWSKAYC